MMVSIKETINQIAVFGLIKTIKSQYGFLTLIDIASSTVYYSYQTQVLMILP